MSHAFFQGMVRVRVAVITGVTGQDGSYLAEMLIEKGYEVHGLNRRTSLPNTGRLSDSLLRNPRMHMHEFDMTDLASMIHALSFIPLEYEILEIYNLAAQSHVLTSFYQPEYSAEVDAIGSLKLLDAVRILKLARVRFYQASTSELYGKVQTIPQNEETPFYPRSPYAVAKLYSFWIVKNYRESYGMFACNGILFNHESERRGVEFVTRKITLALGKYLQDKQNKLRLGNLDSKRDWGYAPDYVEGMWRILQADVPDDFVLATGKTRTVREFVETAFIHKGITIRWEGENEHEKGFDADTGDLIVEVDPRLYRPAEVELLLGDASKAERVLGWKPMTSFEEWVGYMVKEDTRSNINKSL